VRPRIIEYGSEAQARLREAVDAFAAGDLALADAMLTRLRDECPDDAEVLGRSGFVKYAQGQHDAAESLFVRATALDPSRELWSVGLFHSLWKLNRSDEAFDEIRRFLRAYPDTLEYRRLIREMRKEFIEKGWMGEEESK